ncbi:cellulose biosynthesis protein BcsD [Serratia sp. UGAL515B_01]|uniref:cellulose biosynthesis protein BcsD n=1 Tax=Serratia sp. UGAL515B_01 TaxID=2986763 RepID=UPI0029552E0B|nr:cellulose biosynthesis protein BcsD [Serratia sp. UGAL515B_01]WON78082.1 cellulose synthase [Serratia sp. UGAL515B_01]
MQDIINSSCELDYYRQRQFKTGWQDLIQVVFSGILASADDADGRDFLRLMGANLASKLPLPAAETVGELEDGLNGLLRHFDWGRVQIDPTPEQLLLTHYAYPRSDDPDNESIWAVSFATVLEGAYEAWLLAQGGEPHVSLRWCGPAEENTLIFRYKNEQRR